MNVTGLYGILKVCSRAEECVVLKIIFNFRTSVRNNEKVVYVRMVRVNNTYIKQ